MGFFRFYINHIQKVSFEAVVAMAKANNIKLLLIQSPVTKATYNAFINNDYFDNEMAQYGTYYNANKMIQLHDSLDFFDGHHLNQNGVIKYSLEEYMEIENDLLTSKPAAKLEEPIEESLNFTMKVAEPAKPTYATHSDDISPMEMTIEETLKLRADERRRKLKEFNYKFHNNPSRVDELEREPAYKRLGVDLTENQYNHYMKEFTKLINEVDENEFTKDQIDELTKQIKEVKIF
jgi:hypothetical protein